MSVFRETLKQELLYKDIRVKELSNLTGISKHTIDHYLAENSTEPLAEAAVKIASALNVSVEYLITGEDKETKKGIKQTAYNLLKEINYLPDEDIKLLSQIIKRIKHN